jgi:carboxymethylenebutenolidase
MAPREGSIKPEETTMGTAQPDGFLALPAGGKGDAVLVLHAWWGLNDSIKAFCTQLAEAGFVAFAPDLYQGKVVDQIPEAEALSRALDAQRASADVAAAAQYVHERAGEPQNGVALIGFSLGAYFALEHSVHAPEQVRSVVVFYGTRDGDYSTAKAEYLGHFAEADEFEPQAAVDEMAAALQRAGRTLTAHFYPGTGHWFFESDRTSAYNRPAADQAWQRTLEFLQRP